MPRDSVKVSPGVRIYGGKRGTPGGCLGLMFWALMAVFAVGGLVDLWHDVTGSPTAAPTTMTQPSTVPPRRVPTSTVAPSRTPVLLQAEARRANPSAGEVVLPKFTVPSSAKGWTLTWRYNCAPLGSTESFDVLVAGGNYADVGPRDAGMGGSGVEHYHDTGTFALSVFSLCRWSYKVATIPG